VKGSTIARESDYVVYTHAGPEIAVASTKAYTVQIATLYVVGCRIGLVKGCINEETARKFISDLMDVIPAVQSILDHKEEIQNAAQSLLEAQDAFFIGRGIDYTLSLEGALKLKEISYIHAEAYAAGELKHGTIALITPGVPVIAIATQRKVLSKTISNIKEVASRGADVILITEEGIHVPDGICKLHLTIPETEDVFSVFPAAVILQLIAYYTSYGRGLDVDMPRNLAKSVTVE
jgi:glucosamine--fructose-6-phosphate aminotransferase (isomerizing)